MEPRPPSSSKIICIASHCFSFILYKKNNFPASLLFLSSRVDIVVISSLSALFHILHIICIFQHCHDLSCCIIPPSCIYSFVSGIPYSRTPVLYYLPFFPLLDPRPTLIFTVLKIAMRLHCTTRASFPVSLGYLYSVIHYTWPPRDDRLLSPPDFV